MELKEAREKTTKLRNADLAIPVCIAELINIIVALDDRISELERERDEIANYVEELEKIVIELGGVGALPIEK